MRLHRTLAMAIQRHTASQRHVRMSTRPAAVEDDRSPAGRSKGVPSSWNPVLVQGAIRNGHGAIGAVSFAVQSALLDEGLNKKSGPGVARLN